MPNRFFANLGCEGHCFALREANGHFPDHAPIHPMLPICSNYERPRLLLKKRILVLPDGDGDRVGIAGEQAHIISPDRLSLFAQICLKTASA